MSEERVFPIIETERLILRQLLERDTEQWHHNLSDYDVAGLIGMEPLQNAADTNEIIVSFSNRYEKDTGMAWAITLKDTDAFIGTCSYESIDKHNFSGEIGYDLLKEFWGHGYMTESLRPVIMYGFVSYKLNRVEAHTAAINHASRRLLERLGFSLDGISRESIFLRGEFQDYCLYSLLRREWEM
ncbi:MAG: GNAT family N-acetyltransferase [Candidatus Thorarchaeota archaeon]